jgi:mRNA interferase MazF
VGQTNKLWVPDRRDIIWINFSPQRGVEMKDEHPMLVLSPAAFNERTGIVIGLPITHATSNESNPFAVKFTGLKGEACYVLTHQPKSFAWRGRGSLPHPVKQISPLVLQTVSQELEGVISICA